MRKVKQVPFNEAKNPKKADVIFSEKNQSFYRRDVDGKEYCWMAVDANSGNVEFKDESGKPLLFLDGKTGKIFLGSHSSDIASLIKEAAASPELPRHLSEKALSSEYERKDSRKHDIDTAKGFVDSFEERYGSQSRWFNMEISNSIDFHKISVHYEGLTKSRIREIVVDFRGAKTHVHSRNVNIPIEIKITKQKPNEAETNWVGPNTIASSEIGIFQTLTFKDFDTEPAKYKLYVKTPIPAGKLSVRGFFHVSRW